MKIFLTGGTGFIGKNLAKELLSRGVELRLLARPRSNTLGLEGCTFIQGDLDDLDSLRFGMEGCDGVFHAAALVKNWVPDSGEYYRTNVQGLKNVLETARECAVPRIIYTSSFMALGPTDGTVADEQTERPAVAFHNEYERSKTQANLLARQYQQSGLPLVCLYPTIVYGPGELTEGNWLGHNLRRLRKMPILFLVGPGTQNWNYVHVDDVVAGQISAMERAAPGSRYILGGDNRTTRELFELAARLLGRRPPKLKVPFPLARAAAWVFEAYSIWQKRSPWFNPALIDISRHDWAYSSAAAERDLGYSHRRLEPGLEDTVAWMKRANLL